MVVSLVYQFKRSSNIRPYRPAKTIALLAQSFQPAVKHFINVTGIDLQHIGGISHLVVGVTSEITKYL
ncbi:hypothetical protein D3C84_1179290 [compost metagenome]